MLLQTNFGYRLAVTERLSPNATTTAIILHGFMSDRNSRNAKATGDVFLEYGFNCLIPDMYGRGDSDGDFGDLTVAKGVENVGALIALIHQHNPDQNIVLAGSSFGGLVALHATAHFENLLSRLILLAPASDFSAVWRDWLSPDQLAAWAATGSHTDVLKDGRPVTFGRAFYDEIATNIVYDAIAPHIAIPTLIVHGNADDTVPLAQSEQLHDIMPNSQLDVLDGATHDLTPAQLVDYQRYLRDFLRD